MKPPIIVAFLILSLNSLYSQTKDIEIYNEMFKWKFAIPGYFEKVSESESEKHEAAGKEAIEKSTGHKIKNKSIKIYGYKSDSHNQFIVNYQPTQLSKETYKEHFKKISEIMYESVKTKIPTAEIEHSLSSEQISGIKFEVSEMKIIYPNKTIAHLRSYSTIINKNILNIQIVYQDEEKGAALIEAFRSSKFEN